MTLHSSRPLLLQTILLIFPHATAQHLFTRSSSFLYGQMSLGLDILSGSTSFRLVQIISLGLCFFSVYIFSLDLELFSPSSSKSFFFFFSFLSVYILSLNIDHFSVSRSFLCVYIISLYASFLYLYIFFLGLEQSGSFLLIYIFFLDLDNFSIYIISPSLHFSWSRSFLQAYTFSFIVNHFSRSRSLLPVYILSLSTPFLCNYPGSQPTFSQLLRPAPSKKKKINQINKQLIQPAN